ncbi:hypothetical protein M5W98_28970, partial [Paenibacillus apiarius]|nr:hypothetical protein [Paenibacillus apiarius]
MLRKDNKKIYLFISVLIICISLLLPLFHSIYSSVVQTITTEYYNIEAVGEIIQGTEITEDIYIPSGVKKYRIMFATYIRNNVGHVKVEIHQGDRILEELVDVSSLADNAMHEFNMDMSQLKEGQAKLVIRGVDGSSGNAITVYKSQDTSLGKISVNGIEDNAGIIQSFTYHSYDYIVKMKIAFSIIVILCIVGVLYIINFREETAKNSIALFSLAFVTIFSMLNVKAPILTFAAETYAELGTNFYINGLKKGFFENIFITDAGYLPLLQRSISLFIIKVLNLSHYNAVVIMQNVAIAFVSAVSALFCLNKFSEYGSRIFRFTICITVGTCALVVTYYDSHSFINFSYYGLVWIILMSMMDLNSVSKWKAICIIVISGLICISKSYFVILIPIVIFIYLVKRKRLSLRDKGYLLSILIGNVIQLLYTVRNINQWVKPTGSYSFDLMDILQRTTYNVVQQIIYI